MLHSWSDKYYWKQERSVRVHRSHSSCLFASFKDHEVRRCKWLRIQQWLVSDSPSSRERERESCRSNVLLRFVRASVQFHFPNPNTSLYSINLNSKFGINASAFQCVFVRAVWNKCLQYYWFYHLLIANLTHADLVSEGKRRFPDVLSISWLNFVAQLLCKWLWVGQYFSRLV